MFELTNTNNIKYTNLKQIENEYNILLSKNYYDNENIVLEIFNNNIENFKNYDLNNAIILNIIAIYYRFVKKNYSEMKKYFLLAINLKDTNAMNNFANYYGCIKKYDKMKKWILIAMTIDSSDFDTFHNLGYYYECIKNYNKMLKWYLISSKYGNLNSMNYLGHYYESIKNYDEMEKWFLMAIELGCSDAMNNLACYYYEIKNYDKMEKYLLMAINLKDAYAMYNLAFYYQNIKKNYCEMEKYYLLAIELNDSASMFNLGCYYREIKNYGKMKKYFFMAINLCNFDALTNICQHMWNEQICEHKLEKNSKLFLDLFFILKNVKNKNEQFMKIYEEIQKTQSVKYYIYDKQCDELFKNNIQICSICYENKLHVKLDNCDHYVCNICYLNVSTCYQCIKPHKEQFYENIKCDLKKLKETAISNNNYPSQTGIFDLKSVKNLYSCNN